MKSIFFILFFAIVLAFTLSAQPSIHAILHSVKDDERMRIAENFQNTAKDHEFRLPYVESIDFRTDWDRMMSTRQRFRVRANLNGFLQNNAEIKRYNALVNIKTLKLVKEQKDFLTESYMQLLDAINVDKNSAISKELLQHYLLLDNVYRKALASGNTVDIADYLKNKERILVYQSNCSALSQKRSFRYKCLKLDTNTVIETADLITPEQMKAHLAAQGAISEHNIENKQLSAELDFLNAKTRLKKAENSKLIDYVQVGYTVREDLIAENKFTVSLGLTLPYKGTTRVALKELALNRSELLAETKIYSLNVKDEYVRLMEEFEMYYSNYRVINELYQSSDYIRLKESIQFSGHLSVIEAEELKKSEIEAKLRQWEYYHELLICYIKILALGDTIIEMPLRNYLTDATPVL
jgi:hypothetical protein